jgi:hypothetical protein
VSQTIDLTPTPVEFVSIGARLAQDLIDAKTKTASRDDARHVLAGLIDVVRYLATVDAREGTHHLKALLDMAHLTKETR